MKRKFVRLNAIIFLLTFLIIFNSAKEVSSVAIGNAERYSCPSIIIILVDTLRADYISHLEFEDKITPNISQLAKNSISFTNAYSQAPWTRPAVASLLTSMYPSTHGVNGASKIRRREIILSEDVFTLPEYLKDKGYYTAGFITNASISSEFGFSQGYDEYHLLNEPLLPKFSLFEWTDRLFNFCLKNKYYINAKTLISRTCMWLTKNSRKPFFLYIHFMDPHRPYHKTPNCLFSKTDSTYHNPLSNNRLWSYLNNYKSEITYLDHHIGLLINQLKDMGLYEKSLIVFTSDHGEEFYEHGGWDHGHTLYDELLRVPLIIKLPNMKEGRIDKRLVRLIDVFPTIIEFLNFDFPAELQGVPLYKKSGKAENIIPYIFSERLPAGKGDQSIRVNNWKLIISTKKSYTPPENIELYNLENDPKEIKNIAKDNPVKVNHLRSLIAEVSARALSCSIRKKTKDIPENTIENLKSLGYIN